MWLAQERGPAGTGVIHGHGAVKLSLLVEVNPNIVHTGFNIVMEVMKSLPANQVFGFKVIRREPLLFEVFGIFPGALSGEPFAEGSRQPRIASASIERRCTRMSRLSIRSCLSASCRPGFRACSAGPPFPRS